MELKKHIPNALTCGNLLSGCFSILFIASGMPIKAALMIIVAGLFDFLDGFAARLLKAHSPIGADLDSLSDVVSFGVAPGMIMCYMMNNALDLPRITLDGIDLMPCLAFLLPVFAAIRLARFNIDETQHVAFRGIPAPAMAIFVASLPLALGQAGHLTDGALGFWACHHAAFVVHDGEQHALFLVQDEILDLERQRSEVDFPRCRHCRFRGLQMAGVAIHHGALCIAVGVLR